MSQNERWIWQNKNYPNFNYDIDKLTSLIQKVHIVQGELIVLTSTINEESFQDKYIEALTNEAINTSAIEGEVLNRDSVRASIRKKLGIDTYFFHTDPHTEGVVSILLDANTNYTKPLHLERIFGWHNALFPTGYSGFEKINVAAFRGEEEMKVVSGAIGRERTHYVAPPSKSLFLEMNSFLHWFEKEDATLIKASIAHLWFVIIHPLDDGNGRIARAITDLVLAKIENSKASKLYSMSTAILNDRKGYYDILDRTTGFVPKQEHENPLDITLWIEWFLKTLLCSLSQAKENLYFIIEKTKFWDKHRDTQLNSRQIKMLNKVLDIGVNNFEGGINKRKYVAITKTSDRTAVRDLNDLISKGCIRQELNSKGRNVRYEIIV